jgi:hypothetical protein
MHVTPLEKDYNIWWIHHEACKDIEEPEILPSCKTLGTESAFEI